MTCPTAQRLSAKSVDRFRAVVMSVVQEFRADRPLIRVGLVDRKNDDAIAVLDLEKGLLYPATSVLFDVILVEQPLPGHLAEPDFLELKSMLAPDGVILLRRRQRLVHWMGRLLSRRHDDTTGGVFGKGHDRREAALRRASLYILPISTAVGSVREQWLLAATAPLGDRRFRDQIGRVATDYLRALTPFTIGIGATIPSL